MSGRQSEATRLALEYYRVNKRHGVSVYRAARRFGIYPSTLSRALQRKEKK